MLKHYSVTIAEMTQLDLQSGSYALLWEAALKAAKSAYAPYSRYQVGAACISTSGQLFAGANQENAAYPSGLCAERVCAFHAGFVLGQEPIVAMALVALRQNKVVPGAAPCGACRQVLLEYETKQKQHMELLWKGTESLWYRVQSISELLPFRFDQNSLTA